MADEDNKNTPDQKTQGEDLTAFRSEIDNKLSAVTRQLEAMNQGFQAMANRFTPQAPDPVADEDIYDPKVLRDKILGEATRATNDIIQEERRKNAVLVSLSKEYPEIQSDMKMQEAVLEAQKSLPKMLQDTAEGYELAVMKAVAKQGILPKSKRPTTEDSDFSVSGGSGKGEGRTKSKSAKIDDRTLIVAQLLGRDIKDPAVLAGLETANKRDSYSKFR